MSTVVHHSTEPTLRKLGSHLRWLMESAGIKAENSHVVIAVADEQERSLMISKLLREFDHGSMTRHDAASVTVHGVLITIVIQQPRKEPV
jgi:hypothetical protein